MKIAIVCDWLVTFAGAEKALAEMLHCFPEADLFSVVDFLPDSARQLLQNKKSTTTFIQKLPFAKKYYRSYLPLMPIAIEQLDLSSYQLVISSSHAVAKGVITGPDQIHISYVHTPMRYAWDLQHQYLKESKLDRGIKGFLAKYMLHKLRLWDLRSAMGVDHFITNSQFIANRIKKVYRRDAEVIFGPVDTSRFTMEKEKEDYYLTASRMVPYKKMDLIVESFNQMPDKKLIVIGDGPDFNKISERANDNIKILGYQTNDQLVSYMQKAKGFVFAAEEDFGLTPIEAQAAGTPVIAYGKGGTLETIRNIDQTKPTGLFFYNQTVSSLCEAIKEFEKMSEKFTPENCMDNASNFTIDQFRARFKNFVLSRLA